MEGVKYTAITLHGGGGLKISSEGKASFLLVVVITGVQVSPKGIVSFYRTTLLTFTPCVRVNISFTLTTMRP